MKHKNSITRTDRFLGCASPRVENVSLLGDLERQQGKQILPQPCNSLIRKPAASYRLGLLFEREGSALSAGEFLC